MTIPPRAAPARLQVLFPLKADDPPPRTFELGLILGGTVSAGAYTAGALDFLLQALEAWEASTPPHKLIIKMAAGTSGGAVCAAILGVLSSRQVPHVSGTQQCLVADTSARNNPLWDVWVNSFEILKLLSTTDIAADQDVDAGTGVRPGAPPMGDGTPVQRTPSVLNVAMIDQAAANIVSLAEGPGAARRNSFGAPFRAAITLSNLRGIPFIIKAIPTYGQFTGAAFVEHDDFAWFAFPNGTTPTTEKREDEFWLAAVAGPGLTSYKTLADFAIASGTLPLGFVARSLVRPAEHYLYRPNVRAGLTPPGYAVDWIDPDWSELPDAQASGDYRFTAVDGGCFNNDPVSLVHRALAGLIGKNPQSPSQATRAMLMIDPLADQPTTIAPTGRSLVRVMGEVVGMFTQGARYLTADMDLFRNEDVFSRFQMVPTRPEPGRVAEKALAGTGLGAFAGWCAREFRVHDYLLGRANMQAYLGSELVLSGDNPLFAAWPDSLRADHSVDGKGARVSPDPDQPRAYFLPVLPDLTLDVAPLPDWPVGACNPDDLHDPIIGRLEAVLRRLRADNLPGFLSEAAALVAIPGVSKLVATAVINKLRADLHSAQLLAPEAAV